MSAQVPSPVPRSVTRRRMHATNAKRFLGTYGTASTMKPTPQVTEATIAVYRVTQLLSAQAEIERALWLETSGKMGDENSTPRRIVARVVVASGDEKVRDVTEL